MVKGVFIRYLVSFEVSLVFISFAIPLSPIVQYIFVTQVLNSKYSIYGLVL